MAFKMKKTALLLCLMVMVLCGCNKQRPQNEQKVPFTPMESEDESVVNGGGMTSFDGKGFTHLYTHAADYHVGDYEYLSDSGFYIRWFYGTLEITTAKQEKTTLHESSVNKLEDYMRVRSIDNVNDIYIQYAQSGEHATGDYGKQLNLSIPHKDHRHTNVEIYSYDADIVFNQYVTSGTTEISDGKRVRGEIIGDFGGFVRIKEVSDVNLKLTSVGNCYTDVLSGGNYKFELDNESAKDFEIAQGFMSNGNCNVTVILPDDYDGEINIFAKEENIKSDFKYSLMEKEVYPNMGFRIILEEGKIQILKAE